MNNMKTIYRILMMLVLTVVGTQSINAQKTYALLAGVSNYGDEQVNLHNTTKDVKDLKKVLAHQDVVTSVVTSQYANLDNITKKLGAIVKLAKPEDNILFFFSGHGDTDGFIASDRAMFRYQKLVEILRKAKARNVVVFIDACMSGSVKSISANNFGVGNAYPKIAFLTASDAEELSIENNWVGNGYFAQAMQKGLRGKADKNADREVTLMELFTYIYNDVTFRTRNHESVQHPQFVGPESMHSLVLARW